MFDILDKRGGSSQMDDMVKEMRAYLTDAGVKELMAPEEVDAALGGAWTGVVFVNSICGCAAGAARPGFVASLQSEHRPKHAFTVFAGQDKAATEQARKYFTNQPPSSPCIAFFREGNFVGMVRREQIEGATAEELSAGLKELYKKHFQ